MTISMWTDLDLEFGKYFGERNLGFRIFEILGLACLRFKGV